MPYAPTNIRYMSRGKVYDGYFIIDEYFIADDPIIEDFGQNYEKLFKHCFISNYNTKRLFLNGNKLNRLALYQDSLI